MTAALALALFTGLTLVVFGVAQIHVPASLIVAGAAILAVLWDLQR